MEIPAQLVNFLCVSPSGRHARKLIKRLCFDSDCCSSPVLQAVCNRNLALDSVVYGHTDVLPMNSGGSASKLSTGQAEPEVKALMLDSYGPTSTSSRKPGWCETARDLFKFLLIQTYSNCAPARRSRCSRYRSEMPRWPQMDRPLQRKIWVGDRCGVQEDGRYVGEQQRPGICWRGGPVGARPALGVRSLGFSAH